jgi:hypothetical protein
VPAKVETIHPVLIRNAEVVAVAEELSVTRTVTVVDSDAVGVPEIRPVFAFRARPVGRDPVARAN